MAYWTTDGNKKIKPTEFLGTTDGADLVIKTGGNERLRIEAGGNAAFSAPLTVTGNVGIGTADPAGHRLKVDGSTCLGGDVTAAQSLSVTGKAELQDTLTVQKDVTCAQSLTVGGKLAVQQDVTVQELRFGSSSLIIGGLEKFRSEFMAVEEPLTSGVFEVHSGGPTLDLGSIDLEPGALHPNLSGLPSAAWIKVNKEVALTFKYTPGKKGGPFRSARAGPWRLSAQKGCCVLAPIVLALVLLRIITALPAGSGGAREERRK